jgi:hypothetical protein
VDWRCEVHTLYRDTNVGCRRAVTGAIDWLLEHEDDGIILEDDAVPDPTFFAFCDVLLDRYREDPRVAMISGNDYHAPDHPRTTSYTFTRHTFIWGWATWRRAWEHNDPDMHDWATVRRTGWLRDVGDGHADFARYWREQFDAGAAGAVDSWAYRWTYSCWRHGLVSIMPTTHLVANVGFGDDATHTTGDDWRAHLPARPMPMPLTHPRTVERDLEQDRWADVHVYYVDQPQWRQLARKVPGLVSAVRWAKQIVRRRR